MVVASRPVVPGDFDLYRKVEWREFSAYLPEFMDLFRRFWLQGPSEEEFARAVQSVVMRPEVLYFMVTHPIAYRREHDG